MPRARSSQDDEASAGAQAPKATKSSGRVTPKGGAGRPNPPSGRYTPPIPRDKRHSPPWYPWVLLSLLVAGLLIVVLNYTDVMPGGTSNWYLIGGIVGIVGGLIMATFYR